MTHSCSIAAGLLCTLLAFIAGGCAAIFRPSTPNELQITSEPATAQVVVNGEVYTTPVVVALPPANRYILEYRKVGYLPVIDTVETSIGASWLVADLIWALPTFGISLGVDFLSEQWCAIDEANRQQHVMLLPDPAQAPLPDESDKQQEYNDKESTALTTGSQRVIFRSEPKSSGRMSFQIEIGAAFPAYQVPVFFTSYNAGFGYTPADWGTVSIRLGFHGTAARLDLPDAKGIPTPTSSALLVFSTATDLQIPLWKSGFYVAGGAGAMHASARYDQYNPLTSQRTERGLAEKWLPSVSAGGGFIFEGGKWFVDARYTSALSALSALRIASTGADYTPYYTTLSFGFRLLF